MKITEFRALGSDLPNPLRRDQPDTVGLVQQRRTSSPAPAQSRYNPPECLCLHQVRAVAIGCIRHGRRWRPHVLVL
jgi:hypothetical protein